MSAPCEAAASHVRTSRGAPKSLATVPTSSLFSIIHPPDQDVVFPDHRPYRLFQAANGTLARRFPAWQQRLVAQGSATTGVVAAASGFGLEERLADQILSAEPERTWASGPRKLARPVKP